MDGGGVLGEGTVADVVQGVRVGQDAANLGWKLAAVHHGRSADALLDTYHAERHPIGKAVLRSSGLNLRLAMAHNPLEIALRTVRKLVVTHVRPVTRQAVGEITGIGFSYPAPRGAHPLTGKRAPDLELDGGRLYEVLREGRFVLALPPGTEAGGLARNGLVVAHLTGGDEALLVRPDGYYAWAGAPQAAVIEAGLAPWTG